MIMFPLILITSGGVLHMIGGLAELSLAMVIVALAIGAMEWFMGVYHQCRHQ